MANYPAGYRPQGEIGEQGHEPIDVGIRSVLVGAGVLIALCAASFVLLSWMMGRYQADERARDATRPPLFADDRGLFPTPRLQENPNADLGVMRKEDRAELSSYGWVDRKAGIVRIPIERAMEIIAKKGFPPVGEPAKKAETQKSKPDSEKNSAGSDQKKPAAEPGGAK